MLGSATRTRPAPEHFVRDAMDREPTDEAMTNQIRRIRILQGDLDKCGYHASCLYLPIVENREQNDEGRERLRRQDERTARIKADIRADAEAQLPRLSPHMCQGRHEDFLREL